MASLIRIEAKDPAATIIPDAFGHNSPARLFGGGGNTLDLIVPSDPFTTYFDLIQLRRRAAALTSTTFVVSRQVRAELDRSILLRATSRQLYDTALRLDHLRRENEAARRVVLAFDPGTLVDGEVCEDADFLAHLNALGYECDRCRDGEPVSAVVKFEGMATALPLCGECFQELSGLSLGQLT